MNCKKCGSQLTAEDQFCKNCGAAVNEFNAQLNQNNNVVSNSAIPNSNMQSQNINNGYNNISNTNMNGNQNMSYQSIPVNNNVSKNNIIFIIIGVLVVAIIALVIIVVPKFLNNSNDSTENNTNTTIPTSTSNAYKVKYDNFTFNVPDNMVYEVNNDILMIGDEAGTWVVEFTIGDGNFNQLKNNKSQLHIYFQQNGLTAKPAEVKTLGGSEFLTIEMMYSGINYLGAYARLNSMKTAWMVAYNQNNEIDYNILTNMASIISTATYNDSSNSIESTNKFNFDIDEIFKFAQ